MIRPVFSWRPVRRLCRSALAGLILLPVLVLDSRPAEAQEFDALQAIVNPRLTIERTRQIRKAVRRAVGKRLAPADGGGETSELAARLGGVTITPAADYAAADAQIGLNAWLDGTFTEIAEDAPLRAFTSDQNVIIAGLDRQLTDRVLLGALFSYSESDTRNVFVPGTSTTDNYAAGTYFGALLTDNLVFDTSFLYTWTDNFARAPGPVTAAFDGEQWTLASNLTGYWFFGNLRLSPTVGVSYSETRDEAYVDSLATFFPRELTRTGALNFGATLAYTIRLDDVRTAQPYATVEGEWEFEESNSPFIATGAGLPTDPREMDARVAAGIEITLLRNVSLELKGEVGGLARSRYQTVSGGGRLSVSF